MSFTAVRSYFRTRMNSLDHNEWTDGFNFENIPETIQDRAYHIEVQTITQSTQNQTVIDANYPVTIRLIVKGYRDPADAIDRAISFGESAIFDIVKQSNISASVLHDISFVSMLPRALDPSNDNTVVLEMEFNARILLEC